MTLRKVTDWFFAPEKPTKSNYVAPAHALDVGPVIDGYPAYLRVWHDEKDRRLKIELRNFPGRLISFDDQIIFPLAQALIELHTLHAVYHQSTLPQATTPEEK
jgi:hypothetical protein